MFTPNSKIVVLVAALHAFASAAAGDVHAASPRSVLREAQSRVVKIFGAGGLSGLEAYQTGVLVSGEGHIVTVASSVLDQGEATVVTIDGARRTGVVVGANPIADLALLKVDPAGERLPFYNLSSTTPATPGEPIWALANLFGIATDNEPVSVLHGVVATIAPLRARKGATLSYERREAILLDTVTSNPGAAGGAVIDCRGRLLGVIGRELRFEATGAWVSHATPAKEVARVVHQLMSGDAGADADTTTTPSIDFLSTWGFALAPDIAKRTPPYVEYVRPDSLADAAGLRADDLVVIWNGRIAATCRDVHRLADADSRVRVVVTVQRGDKLIDVNLESSSPVDVAAPIRRPGSSP